MRTKNSLKMTATIKAEPCFLRLMRETPVALRIAAAPKRKTETGMSL